MVENDWTINSLKEHFDSKINQLTLHFDTINKETDLRYQQRYDASLQALIAASLAAEKAVNAALAAAKEAVNAASISAEKSVSAALAAAEKAITKAENAQLLHNTLTNEWRATVNDVTKTVADNARLHAETLVASTRENFDIAIKSLTEKIDKIDKIANSQETRHTSSLSNTPLILSGIAILVSIIIGSAVFFKNTSPRYEIPPQQSYTTNSSIPILPQPK
ncbi:MAG TPA: hypothetical protein VK553_03935 [Candidatus Nitrosopolaris rasttigaisensis]|nr:hypothetical protein [Candidatus Nitrosopolaris rasttigaisensis]